MKGELGLAADARTTSAARANTLYPILFAISFVHLLNDSIQAVIPAIFPILEQSMKLTYFQVGMIAFTLSFTASILQPVVGLYTDAKPTPGLLPLGMVSTFLGMLGLAFAPNYVLVILSVIFIGIGSAVFHPEGARVANMAAGSRRGLAQSIFQVGGNGGQALAPIMTALIFVPLGQIGAVWFTLVAFMAIMMQLYVARWYRAALAAAPRKKSAGQVRKANPARRKAITIAFALLIFFIFARSWYHAAISTYYPFFLIKEYGIKLDAAQIYIFLFLAAGVIGTFFGGPISERIGRRTVMAISLLGTVPFALLLPHVGDSFWAYPILFVSGLLLLSSFSVMVVYAQDLVPGKIGTVSGITLGLAFGLGAIGSAALGGIADLIGIRATMELTSLLPLLGFLVFLLPTDKRLEEWAREDAGSQSQ